MSSGLGEFLYVLFGALIGSAITIGIVVFARCAFGAK